MNRTAHRTPLITAVLVLLSVPAGLDAQYFGRNMVQYDRFDFRRFETAHFSIYAYTSEEAGAREVARLVERWYERHARTFEWEFRQKKPFLLYADQPDFQQSTLGEGRITEGTGGFTEPLKDRVVLPMTGSLADDDHVIGHELVHSFQFDIVESTRGGGIRGISALPLWFVEGMAEYLSLGRHDPHTTMWLRDAVLRDDFPSLAQLSRDARYFPYRYGQGLTAYIAGRWGRDALIRLFREASRRGFEPALQEVLGMPGDTLVDQWRAAVEAEARPVLQGRTPPAEVGRLVLGSEDEEQPLYIAPVASPDGRFVAFFSARDLFSIDLYLAEVETGRVVGRLASAATDPHLDALRFVESSGSWSPDGARFAYVGYAAGDNEVVVADVESRRTIRRYATPGVGSIQNVAWSPDGLRIAFSGTVGGFGDLFILDVETGAVEQITRDRYSNLQPSWSPDGRVLAYVTDEGEDADLQHLSVGRPRIALLTLSTGERRIVRPFAGAKHINPQFSPDGVHVYFVSDPEGVSDVFLLDLGTEEVAALTHVATGVSGITSSAPALSVAAKSGDILLSVFRGAGYTVHALPSDAPREVVRGAPAMRAPSAGTLPPAAADWVSAYLGDSTTGLQRDAVVEVTPYRARLGLTYVYSPEIAVGVNSFGTQLGGGVGAVFSDILETQEVGVATVVQGSWRDAGAQAYYQNKRNRLRWAVSGGHIPYRADYAAYGFVPVEVAPGDTAFAEVYQQFTERIYFDQLGLSASYPLSTTRRVEGGISGTRLGYGLERFQQVLSGPGAGRSGSRQLPAPSSLYFAQASAAFVTDNSFFGFTSPVRGGRSRYEVGATSGDLDFLTVLVDSRRYFFRNPSALAFRVLHYGRYTGDASSNRLTPLFLGYETLVRGYESGSFEVRECAVPGAAAGTCPVFDRLRGSRIAVANAELRLAFLGVERLGLIEFPYLPTELAFFVDAGAAWGTGEDLKLEWARRTADRVPVVSTGVSARMNLFGALVLEIYYAYPFQRPDRGAHFGFGLAPGW